VYLPGWDAGWSSLSPDRFIILEFHNLGTTIEETYGFWPMLLGGIFLYMSFYGTDKSKVQIELSVGNVDDARRSLLVNAVGRFPLILS